ncbi:MAG TPA: tRNA1(Val) (adenine(37)-N6)-methyltransferase [Smithellaceae bacterium]|nr:tRNA1(Val) (adenine(37)-N6)-methyltransferase [Smithellaceae bacterium]
MDEETLDTILDGRLRIFQRKNGYRFSLDAVLLAHFVSLKSKGRAVDLGTGSGVIPLILAARFPQVCWTGLEIQEEMATRAERSIRLNCLQDRIRIVQGDARCIKDILPAHSFDAVIFNPPYRKINSGKINPLAEKAIARHELQGSLDDFLQSAKYLLKPTGRVFTIYPAERLAELVFVFRACDIEPKRMKFVFSDAESLAEFVLAEGRLGSREELKVEPPLIIYGKDRMYTLQMQNIFSCLASAGGGEG